MEFLNTQKCNLRVFSFAVILGIAVTPVLGCDSLQDSSSNKRMQKLSNIKLTARVHSLGLFGYAGLIANENPAADLTLIYNHKNWGYLLTKAVDLYDIHSPYDFTLGLLYANFHVGKKTTITPYGGFVLEQTRKFADHGSDAISSIVNTLYRVDKHFSIEHTALFSNVMLETKMFDWLNRMKLIYTREHLDLTLMGWNNNQVFDDSGYTSVGFNVAYSRIKVSQQVMLSTGITALVMVNDTHPEDFEKRDGLLLTIAATID